MSTYHGKDYYTLRSEKEFITEIADRFLRTELRYSAEQLRVRKETRKRFGSLRGFITKYLRGLEYRTLGFSGQSITDGERRDLASLTKGLENYSEKT